MHLNNSWALREKSEGCGKQRDMEILIELRLRTHSFVGHVTEKEKDVKHGVRRNEDTNMTGHNTADCILLVLFIL
jgi:hypothetical protein